MTQRRRVTIREVAEAAGVSSQTVSRVINERPDVSPETLERVRRIIADVGYAPNMLARGLTQGRSHTLGVVAYGLEYYGPSRVLTGIEQEAASLGYAISLNLVHEPETGDVDRVIDTLLSRQVDGIIWAVPEVGDNRVRFNAATADMPVPVLVVGGRAVHSDHGSIGIDNRAIGVIATSHLLAGGARFVGHIAGPPEWWEARERQAGWAETLRARALEAAPRQVVVGDWGANSGESGLLRLLEAEPRLDAVFAANDQMALGVLHAAHKLGRQVPDDLSVVGTDNIPEASHFWPSLTTVDQPLRDAGALAVRELVEVLRRARQAHRARHGMEPEAAPEVLLEPSLIVRDSSRA